LPDFTTAAGGRNLPTPDLFAKEIKNALYILSVALVRGFRRTGITRYGTLWCPDFPPASSEALLKEAGDHLADFSLLHVLIRTV
jgi:hypothetical protein